MKVLTAKVRGGQLEVPAGTLRDGETVTLLVPEGSEETFTLAPEERDRLREALAQGRRGEGIDGWQLLDEIRA